MSNYTNKKLYETVLREASKRDISRTLGFQCLSDEDRTLTLMDIIVNTVNQGDVIADLGAGTGILGLAGLYAGAKKLYSVDNHPGLQKFIGEISRELGVAEKMVIEGDALSFTPLEKIDFVIAELVNTGITKEPLTQAIKNIIPYTSQNAQFLPEQAVSFVTLMEDEKKLSNPIAYDEVYFPSMKRDYVNTIVSLPVIHKGFPTHLNIDTTLRHPGGHFTQNYQSLCQTIAAEIEMTRKQRETENPLIVAPGQLFKIKINYLYDSHITAAYMETV
jgi:predicted RNA methylase